MITKAAFSLVGRRCSCMSSRFRREQVANVGIHCKDCQKRYPGCHDKCERYKKALAEHHAQKNRGQEARTVSREWMRYVRDNR